MPEETCFFVRSQGGDIFGILTKPAVEATGVAVLLLWGAGDQPSFGPNRVRARLARRLAAAGFHAVRFDYPGHGDSTGRPPRADMDQEAVGTTVRDVAELASWLRASGLSRLVLVGSCFGSRVAQSCVGQVPGIAALALLTPPALNYEYHRIGGRTSPGRDFQELLARSVRDGLPVLLLYGRPDMLYLDFEQARAGALGQQLTEAGSLVTLHVSEEPVHNYPTVAGQDEVIEVVGTWLSSLAASAAAHRPASPLRTAGRGMEA